MTANQRENISTHKGAKTFSLPVFAISLLYHCELIAYGRRPQRSTWHWRHINVKAFQITGSSNICPTVRSDKQHRDHRNSAWLLRGTLPVTAEFPSRWAYTTEWVPCHDVITNDHIFPQVITMYGHWRCKWHTGAIHHSRYRKMGAEIIPFI